MFLADVESRLDVEIDDNQGNFYEMPSTGSSDDSKTRVRDSRVRMMNLFGDGLDKIRNCRFSCVSIKNSSQNGYCGSGFILHTRAFELLHKKLTEIFEQRLGNAKFYTDFKYLIVTSFHVVQVRNPYVGPS